MAKKRRPGNPYWGKPEAYREIPTTSRWDEKLRELGISHLSESEIVTFVKEGALQGSLLRQWIKKYSSQRYVPEKVLKGLNITPNIYMLVPEDLGNVPYKKMASRTFQVSDRIS